MAKILIVDDEQNILKALWRELFEETFAVEICLSAEEALKLLEKDSFQLVISDMRMPGMDGARFLEIVQLRFPHINRTILTGYTDQAAALEIMAKGIATAFIPKPWEKAALRRTILKSLEIQQLLGEWKLLDVVTRIENLPSLPRLFHEISRALRADASAVEVARLIQKDAGMTTRVLQVANSSFYSWRRVTAMERAVTLIGMEGLRKIVLLSTVLSAKQIRGDDLRNLTAVVAQSQVVNAQLQKVHELRTKSGVPESLACVGILQDIGKILLLQHLPDRIRALLQTEAGPRWTGFHDREIACGFDGCTHAEIGAYFLKWWNLPDELVEAVLFHHAPARSGEGVQALLETLDYLERVAEWAWDHRHEKRPVTEQFRRPWLAERKLTALVSNMQDAMREQEQAEEVSP